MSTGQMYSGKGETTTQSPQNEQSVANPTVQSVTSHISLANAQIEAAVSYFIRNWQGTDIPDNELQRLGNSIKAIVSQTFTGEAEITPDTELPLFVQVPDYIATQLGNPEQPETLLQTLQLMRDAALDRYGALKTADFEAVCEAFQLAVNTADQTYKSRSLGFDTTLTTAPAVEPEGASTPQEPSKKKPRVTYYDASRTAYLDRKVIESDSIFFDLLTEPDEVAQLIENISAWYSCWCQHIDESAGEIESSHFQFPHIIGFLGRIAAAAAEVEIKSKEAIASAAFKSNSELLATLTENGSEYRAIIDEYKQMLTGALDMVKVGQDEILRLRKLYEPDQHPTTAEGQEGGSAQ